VRYACNERHRSQLLSATSRKIDSPGLFTRTRRASAGNSVVTSPHPSLLHPPPAMATFGIVSRISCREHGVSSKVERRWTRICNATFRVVTAAGRYRLRLPLLVVTAVLRGRSAPTVRMAVVGRSFKTKILPLGKGRGEGRATGDSVFPLNLSQREREHGS
jgi:hypothetical protein